MAKRWIAIIAAAVLTIGIIGAGTYVYATNDAPSAEVIKKMTERQKNDLGKSLSTEQLESMSTEQLQAIEPAAGDPNASVKAENGDDPNATPRFSSGVGGKLSPSARKAIEDPKNKGKWIGMQRGPDGLLYVDRIQDKPSK